MSKAGRSLELFFIDGRPDGMLTAEVFNWTGHVLRIPRTQLKEGLARREASYTGVYVLIGETETGTLAYVGEAEDMRERIKAHVTGKDWWDQVVMITTSANNLHKAHIKYLEARLVEIGKDVNPTALENGNTPPKSSLSEAAVSNMESFLDTLTMVLPAIRVDIFLNKKKSSKGPQIEAAGTAQKPEFIFKVVKHNVDATAVLEAGEMVVKAGSKVRPKWGGDPKHNLHYIELHEKLVKSGVISPQGEFGIMTEDYAFSSPSAAAAVVAGRSANGRTSWRLKSNGVSFAEWDEKQLITDPT